MPPTPTTTRTHSSSSAYAISNLANGMLVSEAMVTIPSTTYTVNTYLHGEMDSVGSEGNWQINACFYKYDGAPSSCSIVTSSSAPAANWTQVSGTVTSPADAATMKLELVGAQLSGWLAWDDMSVSLDAQMITKYYYYAGSQRVALRRNGVLNYLLSDHLGSASVVTDAGGSLLSKMLYKPWGETRYSSGVMPTDRLYTGQIAEPNLGLYFYNARWYDSSLSRFVQADTFIPQMANAQSWDRFAYVNNSPLMYTDPSGHWMCDIYDPGCVENAQDMAEYGIMVYESGLLGNNPGSSNPTDAVNDLWSNDVHASGNLLRFTVGWEDFSAKPYEDSNGYCTVGFGHNCADEDLTKYSSYTYMDFWDLFLGDLKNAEAGVRKAFQDLDNQYFSNINGYTLGNYVPINQAEFDALVDFSFNAGEGTVYDLIGKNLVSENTAGVPVKNIAGFENALRVDYTGGGGIQIRRGQEIEIFLHQNYYHSH